MIELRIQPVVGAVALIAGCSELRGEVVRVVCRFKVRGVAGIAIRRHRLELAVGRALVAGIAIHRCMRSSERKAIIVLLHLLNGNRPSLHRVTLLTIRAELPLVNIGMAILASLPHIREHGLDVALRARHRLVHATKRIASVIVVELRNRTDGLPSLRRVAVLTGHVEIAMGTVGTSVILGGGRRSRHRRERQR